MRDARVTLGIAVKRTVLAGKAHYVWALPGKG
jgi:hypothetical protein